MIDDDGRRKNNPIMNATTKALGMKGEELATTYLIASGYEIVARNIHCRFTELDIIAKKAGMLCFIEVRYRKDSSFGHPLETITPIKVSRLKKGIAWYLKNHGNHSQREVALLFLSVLGAKNPVFELCRYEG